VALLAAFALVLVLSGGGSQAAQRVARPALLVQHDATPTTPAHSYAPSSGTRRPNIVFVLTDDLSRDLVRFMPQVQALQTRGLSFDNYFVSDSLCCPSRASIFTGNFPHDTHVFGNTLPKGGVAKFFKRGEQHVSFNIALHRSGYATAMMGKYLNGYLEPGYDPKRARYIPPGWTEWDVAGWGYPEFNYPMNIDGTVRYFGNKPRDYLTDVLARRGVKFINRMAQARRPFFLELATFAPHHPYTPAPRDANDFPGLVAPQPPSFDVLPTHPPSWLAGHPPLSAKKLKVINTAFRKRAQSVQAVDRMISRVNHALEINHLTRDTYVIFSSDNGLHTGEYRLTPGKLTAFDTDIRVPLFVAGPGVPVDRRSELFAQNIDLAKTFDAIARAKPTPDDGVSLLPVLHGKAPPNWQNAALIEHHGPTTNPRDPDFQNYDSANPTSYEAIRTAQFLYVEYRNGQREFYNLRADPYELHNVADKLNPSQRKTLHAELKRLRHCHTSTACQAAARLPPLANAPK
jgi:N-acetylglucosamine-6-sulfatase